MQVKIKEVGPNITTYKTITGNTKEELFNNIYQFFKSYQYCWQVDRSIDDKTISDEYYKWKDSNNEKLWYKYATTRDYD